MLLHHTLLNRVEITGVLELKTGLHIGTSVEHGTANASVIRDAFGKPFIPGSSLKGAFRSRVETLAHALIAGSVCLLQKSDEKLLAADRDENRFPEPERCLSSYRDGANVIQKLAAKQAERGDVPDLNEYLQKHLCPACRLFGGASWRSKVAFDDLHLAQTVTPPAELRDGVGLDRDSRTAVKNVKYDFEALPAQTRFFFRCSAENLDETHDWPLLAAGLLELCYGHLPLGGKVTRGLGAVQLNAGSLRVHATDFRDPKQVLLFFTGIESPKAEPDGLAYLHNKLKNHLEFKGGR